MPGADQRRGQLCGADHTPWPDVNDERGQKAAMSIEFGRGPNDDGKGAMEGLAILRRAVRMRR